MDTASRAHWFRRGEEDLEMTLLDVPFDDDAVFVRSDEEVDEDERFDADTTT